MKHFKISFIPVLAILIAAVMSAFTMRTNTDELTEAWFIYSGSGSMTDPGNYTYYGTGDPGCSNTDVLCSVKVTRDAGNVPNEDALIALYNLDDNHFSEPIEGFVEFRDTP